MKEKLQDIYKNIKNCNTCSGTIKFKGKLRFGFPPSNDYIAMIIEGKAGRPHGQLRANTIQPNISVIK